MKNTKIKQIKAWLVGRKTYLVAVATALYAVLQSFGLINITAEQERTIGLLIIALFGVTIRLGISKK